jgi:serine/threonine protein phosphatase 1
MPPDAIPGRHRPPADAVLYAVGDIHGRSDLLDRLHAAILRDAARRRARRRVVVYLGDYIDRGFDSAGVVARLAGDGPPGFERHFLLGNHDQFLLDVLDGDTAAIGSWLWNGGREALASYKVAIGDDAAGLGLRIARAVPAAHLAFLRALKLHHREGGILFAHAGLRPGVPLADQSRADLLWIRDEFLESDCDFGNLVVHGHTPGPEPVVRPNRVGVDTGAWKSGRLTAAAFEGDELTFLQT